MKNKLLQTIKTSAIAMMFLLLFAGSAFAQLGGTYTVNASASASATNYQDVTSVVEDLTGGTRSDGGTANGPGVKSAVLINIASDTYYGKYDITPISGASATNSITFTSAAADSSKVILADTSYYNYTYNYVVRLNGADFITFKKVTILRRFPKSSTYNYYGNVIVIKNNADSNSFLNNRIIGPYNSGQTTSSYQSLVYSGDYPYTNDSFNTFKNNVMKYGNFAFYYFGSSSTSPESGTIIDGNEIDSFIYMGVYTQYQQNISVQRNYIANINNSGYGYGLYMYYTNGGSHINNNKVIIQNGYYGMMLYYLHGWSGDSATVFNNFVSCGNGTYYGIYLPYPEFVNVYHNSVNKYGNTPTTQSGALCSYSYSSSNPNTMTVFNNILVNTDNANYNIPIFITSTSVLANSDYNDFYTTGTYIGYYSGFRATLSDWQSATSMDANSMDLDPFYKSKINLHITNVSLDGKGTPIYPVTKDIDDETRNTTTPDMGADEFFPCTNDAGILSVDSPSVGFCAGTKDVYVTIRNYGTAVLTSATVNWTVNGTAQTAYSFSGTIAIGGSASVKIGSVTIAAATTYTIIAKTASPNGATDCDITNDSAWRGGIRSGMSGTYTIGGSSPNFSTFSAAVKALVDNGLCTSVVFNIADGSYADRIIIPYIGGSSVTKTITFQSTSNDSTKVILNNPSSTNYGDPNYTVQFWGATNVTFRKMTISRDGTGYYASVIDVRGNSKSINIINNRITSTKSTFGTSYLIASQQDADSAIVVQNNIMRYGLYAAYMFGTYGTREDHNVFSDNTVDSCYYGGCQYYYQTNFSCRNNKFSNIYQGYGLYGTYINGESFIINNKIIMNNSNSYGIYLNWSGGNGSDSMLMANNVIACLGSNSVGLMSYYNNYITIVHNNINVYGTSGTNNYAGYFYHYTGASGMNVWNNNFVNPAATSNILYTSGTSSYAISDENFNNLYDTAFLSYWRTTYGFGINSIATDPLYFSKTDLHVKNVQLNSAATPVGILTDIDGQTRSTTTPDIGADEIFPPADDAGIYSIDSPNVGFCAATKDIYVRLRNFGVNALTSVTVNWSLNGTAMSAYYFTGTLKSGFDTLLKVGNNSFSAGSSYKVIAYTSNPNGTTDGDNTNDTFKRDIRTGMSGTYTIGGSSPDYATFTASVVDLISRGVCSSVTFNVRDGMYNEQIIIPAIGNVSSVNTVTYQSQSMDSSKAKLWYAASSNSSDPNYLMILNGAKYFTFKKLGFWRTSPNYVPYAEVIILNNKASNNTITNCWISGPYGYNYQSSCISTTGGKCDNNAFTYNRIKDNYYGINLRATTLSTSDKYNMVKGNDVDSVRQYGLYLYYQDSITVTKNTLKNFQQAYSMGMYCYYLTNNSIITKNKIILTNGGYGLYMFYVIGNGSVTDTCLVANNFISVTAPYSYSCYGIMSYYHDYINFYNNSVLINTTSSGGYGGYFYRYSTANSALVMNNSFVNTSTSGYAIAQSYNGYGISYSDYNNLYSGGSVGLWNGSAQATLADWQSSSSFDANSVSQDPKYFATNDLHTKSPFLDGKGTRVYSVKDDIDGEVRDTLTPDIGADEFFIYKDDIGVTAIIDPNVVTCGDSFTTVTIKITNFGTKKAQGYPISVAVKGASTISQTISDTLYAGADTTITLTSKINTYAGGTYTLKAYTGYSADANHINDTLWQNFKFTPHAANPTTVGFSSCGSGSVTLYAYSTNGDTAYWYDAPTAGKLLTVNNKYTTPTLTTSTTYWVQTDAFRTRVGPYDNSATFTSGGNANTSSFGLTFDAPLQDIVIDSLTVYPYKTGYMQIDVVTSTGKRVATWHDTVYVGFTNDSVRIAPKLQVPKGTNYRIICDSSKTGGFWRSTAGMKYVYNAAKKNICKIKSNGSGSTSTYDVFYNWGVSTRLICPSQRVPVKAVIGSGAKPTASFTLGTSSTCTGTSVSISDKSTISSGTITSWYITFGDGNTYSSTSTGSTSHSYSTAGKFKVLLTVTGSGGCQDTISKYVTINTLPMVGFSANDVCLGTATNFTDTSKKVASGAVYSWDFGDGNSSAAINPSHTYATSGSFTVKLVIANGTCKDSITRTVKVNSTPKAKFGFSGAGCGGASISFVDSSTNAANYLWSFGDGNTSTASSPSHAYAVAGTYTVKLFTSNGTCYDSTSHTLTVAPNPVANFSYSGALCLNKVISFKDSSSISSGKITSYSWSFGDGNSDTAMNPTHSYTKSGTMTVVLSVTSDAGCTGKAAIKALAIDVDASPAFTFNNDSLRYYSFTATDTKAASYDWQFGDGGSSNAANPTHKYATNDTFKVTLTVTNSTGCIFTKTTKLSVFTGIVLTYNPVYEVNVAPNPFHDNATISYTLPTDANVDAGIYDMMGRKVATLVNTKQSSGSYQVVFTPESTQSSAGIYMLRLNVNGETITREIIRLR